MKNKYLFLIPFVGLLLTSCFNKLDEPKPQNSIKVEEALNTPDKIKKAVIGIYGNIRDGALYGGDYQMCADLLAGEFDIAWWGTFNNYENIWSKQMVADNATARTMWVFSYNTINSANKVLENIQVITDTDERNQAKGEALFLRALCHFELVRFYAQPYDASGTNAGLGIPLALKSDNFEKVKRNTIAEVYNQVVTDLLEAETLLPVSNSYFASKFRASAYLARVYLQMGNYTAARDKANDVIANGGYTLNATVTQAFTTNNSPEGIFEIQQNITQNAGQANAGLATFYGNLPTAGRGDIEITEDHLDLYEANDKRANDLIYIGDAANSPGGDVPSCGKWTDPTKNYVLMRLAEMYLIRAESNFALNTVVGATPLADINRIRNRAGLANLTTLDLDAIKTERTLELAFEGHKSHDFKRWKEDIDGKPYNHPKLIFPIPRRELDANPNLVQNPGY